MSLPSYSFGAEGVEFGRSSAYYALAGTGGGDGVTEIIAGSNITISPLNGQGAVTINASGGSAGVTSVTGSGAGLSVSGPTGAVTLANTGVTSLIAGAGLAVSGSTGAVTVSATAPYTTGALNVSGNLTVTGNTTMTNVQGTYTGSPVGPLVTGPTPVSLTGQQGYGTIVYFGPDSDIPSRSVFVGNIDVVSATAGSVMMVMPTGSRGASLGTIVIKEQEVVVRNLIGTGGPVSNFQVIISGVWFGAGGVPAPGETVGFTYFMSR
jgi:hypothetical protein